ncbi:hypothetical protein [Bradyrhizobium sp. JYMT SZCCT0180]|uniref:hypothetical protein n=1 Tax=Bradyrhizobium sp. JYMT SZCCT0180 TaxID=2807666 RepID=UPI002011EFA8|nr:hypothetical protein [Bradyrhizobium sp. JYMT SZCCT0180]
MRHVGGNRDPRGSDTRRSAIVRRKPDRIGIGRCDRLNIADEPEAAPVQRPDKKLIRSVVAKHASGAIDAAGERGFRDHPAMPDRVDQLILADDPVMVAHQVNNDIEDLRLDVDGHALAAQLVLTKVDLEIGKSVSHYHLSGGRATILSIADRNQPLAEEKPTSPEGVRQA